MILGTLVLAGLGFMALSAPWLAPQAPDRQDLAHRFEGPTMQHPLGRDDLGRDVLSRLLWGARISLTVGFLVVLVSGTAGALAGTIAGYAGGWPDTALMAMVDLLLGFPGVLLAIALVSVLGARLENLILALCLIGWVTYARVARGQAQKLRGMEFIAAARSLGGTPSWILFRHVMPNLLGPLTVQAALGLGGAILAEAGLSFLGLGTPPPAPSWGSMLQGGSQNLMDAPHLAISPGVALFLAVLGAQAFGDGLQRRLADVRGGARREGEDW
jgi:peptide/nickel transport system permease protein